MARSTFSGPIVSTNGFTGNITGNVTGVVSGTTETLTAAGAISTSTAETHLNFAAGGAVTLAAPTVRGLVKVIDVSSFSVNYTLALTNVVEGTAATTATFTSTAGRLVLLSDVGLGKWIVLKQSAAGLTLA